MPDAYAAADVLVLPSDAGETWGLVVNEAMASGRPAVVSRAVGCCADLVVETETGYGFDLHDIGRLAEIMQGYIRDVARARRQGAAAQAHVQSFCQQAVVDGILQATKDVIKPTYFSRNPVC
jgi:glycosyltransferase involved in cell wall biosynthesis